MQVLAKVNQCTYFDENIVIEETPFVKNCLDFLVDFRVLGELFYDHIKIHTKTLPNLKNTLSLIAKLNHFILHGYSWHFLLFPTTHDESFPAFHGLVRESKNSLLVI